MILGNFHTGGKQTQRVVRKGNEGIKDELSFKGNNFTNSVSGEISPKCSSKLSPLISRLEKTAIRSMLITGFHSEREPSHLLSYLIILGNRGWRTMRQIKSENGSL